jgi:hypothetical protein
MAGGVSFFGFSATIASVVMRVRGCILQRDTDYLGWVNDTLGNQIGVLALLRIVTVRIGVLVTDLADND